MSNNVIKSTSRLMTIEVTEDEFDVICIAVQMLHDSIKNGDCDIQMDEQDAYRFGQAIGGIAETMEFDLDSYESDEDEE